MFFPPPGVKIRRTIETFFLPGTPTMIAEHDSRRVLLLVFIPNDTGADVAFAGSMIGLATAVSIGDYYKVDVPFFGPEEVWAQCLLPSSPPGVNLLVQSVFYD